MGGGLQECNQDPNLFSWIQVLLPFGPNFPATAEEQDRAHVRGRPLAPWVQISSFTPEASFRGPLKWLLESLLVRSAPNHMQVGAADGQEPHMVLMSLKNTEQKITAQRLSGCRLSSCRQPLAECLERIKQMEPLWNNSVCAPFPTTAKEKVSAYFIC